jgi:hypothetical protein
MKIRDYTFNNGNCVIHDTTALPHFASADNDTTKDNILRLIHAGEGKLTGYTGVTYKITQEEDSMCMSVDVNNIPLWISFICPSVESANMIKQFLKDYAYSYPEPLRAECRLPENIIAPCIITMVQPSAIFVPKDTIRLLGGVPRDFAAVFLNSTEKK